MEQRMTHNHFARGFVLPMVLFITAIGLLFGAGALLLFRYQCQLRIDRQHELEKVYAVRSALNYIRTYDEDALDEGLRFGYHTASERNLGVIVKPVAPIFPDTNRVDRRHFVMEHGDLQIPPQVAMMVNGWYDSTFDCECGVRGATTNLLICNTTRSGDVGLKFGNLTETNTTWWVNVGMRDTGGWLQDDYGRRYYFYPGEYVDGNTIKDVMRLCIIRNITNENNKVGRRHGWPLSTNNERALVFEIIPNADAIKSTTKLDATMRLQEYVYINGSVITNLFLCETNFPSRLNVGMQIAHNKISVFSIENPADSSHSMTSRGYAIFGPVDLPQSTYDYFAKDQWIGSVKYPGTNVVNGRVVAPDLRAVFEVEAASDKRGGIIDSAQLDYLTKFRVTPAYQYDVYLEHPTSKLQLATVAQKIGEWIRKGVDYTVLTYDTHGTEHKGFRYDEKHAGENK